MGIRPKGQSCGKCKHCDGFACLYYDVWIDDGKIYGDKRKNNYMHIQVYGKKYCKHYSERKEK